MRQKIERFLFGLTALALLMLYLTMAWIFRIEDPFGEAQKDEMLREQAGLRP
jgi:hypothetical protein